MPLTETVVQGRKKKCLPLKRGPGGLQVAVALSDLWFGARVWTLRGTLSDTEFHVSLASSSDVPSPDPAHGPVSVSGAMALPRWTDVLHEAHVSPSPPLPHHGQVVLFNPLSSSGRVE